MCLYFPQPINLYHPPSAGAGVRLDLSRVTSGVGGLTQTILPF